MVGRTYYDLGVSDTQLEPSTQKERVAVALSLGYDGVALVHQASAKLTSTDKCSMRKLMLEELLSAAKGFSKAAESTGSTLGSPYKAIQLTRLNLPVDDTNTAQESCANRAIIDSYDIIAAQPVSERAFAFACTTLNIDLISVDLSKRLSIRFKPELVSAAIERGVYFDIQYSAAFRDAGVRRQLFANAQALTRATRGRGVVLTSGAHTVQDLRGCLDIANLGTFLGMSEKQARESVTTNAAAVVQHARTRKAYRETLFITSRDKDKETASAMQIDKDNDVMTIR